MKTIRTFALSPVTIVIFALAWGAILMGSGRKTALAASPDGLISTYSWARIAGTSPLVWSMEKARQSWSIVSFELARPKSWPTRLQPEEGGLKQ